MWWLVLVGIVGGVNVGPEVRTTLGPVRGISSTSWTGTPFFSFKGLRFAKPPLGSLRFKPPQPLEPWTETMDATKDHNACPQPRTASGPRFEDCLFLNVYTKNLNASKPVIVFFHPGGFFFGSARSDVYGPNYLLDKDIVLVTANYRLGALGMMSTGDEHAMGNCALKDQVATLRWVRDNIKVFGGDKNKVTIAGCSAGSSSAFLHMLSPMSKGLFRAIIGLSGGATSGWVITQNPLELARKVAKVCGCDENASTGGIVKCLQKVPAEVLGDAYVDLRPWVYDPLMVFGAVIEPKITKDERFLTGMPIDILRSGKFTKVPVVTGFTKDEFKFRAFKVLRNETLRKAINEQFNEWAPTAFYYEKGTAKSRAFSSLLRKFYFGNKEIEEKSEGMAQLYSDALIIYGVQQTAKLIVKYGNRPVYFYVFNYEGPRVPTNQDPLDPNGVMHMHDLRYIFSTPKIPYTTSDDEAKIVKLFTAIFETFAHTGIPDPLEEEEWNQFFLDEEQYLEIDNEFSMKSGLPYKDRMNIWEKMYPTFLSDTVHKVKVFFLNMMLSIT